MSYRRSTLPFEPLALSNTGLMIHLHAYRRGSRRPTDHEVGWGGGGRLARSASWRATGEWWIKSGRMGGGLLCALCSAPQGVEVKGRQVGGSHVPKDSSARLPVLHCVWCSPQTALDHAHTRTRSYATSHTPGIALPWRWPQTRAGLLGPGERWSHSDRALSPSVVVRLESQVSSTLSLQPDSVQVRSRLKVG